MHPNYVMDNTNVEINRRFDSSLVTVVFDVFFCVCVQPFVVNRIHSAQILL